MLRIDFNAGWRFRKKGAEKWVSVTLPHDAMLNEERSAESKGGSAIGYFTGGIYEYSKDFIAPSEWRGKYISLEFEGIYCQSQVFIDGKPVGGCRNGYRDFTVDISSHLRFGENNGITVIADNSQIPNSRWYTGSGIYRPVWLNAAPEEHINNVRITTLSYDPAKIKIEVDAKTEAAIEILGEGKQVASAKGNSSELTIPDAKLWSDETPYLYTCKAALENGDVSVTEFGIRKIEWSTKGLFINGKETLLRGACVHHDNGVLGAATYAKSEERRVRILKEFGYNAIRSAHNPASDALIAACDKHGMYLMDETWDMWYNHKNKFDYATVFYEEYKTDIAQIVERDYNHPSVIMYSLGNEVSEPYLEKGQLLLKEMLDYIHSLDDSRPATAGINLMLIELASRGRGIYKEEGGRFVENRKKPKKEKKSGSLFFNMMTSFIGTNMNRFANAKHVDKVTSPALDTLDIAGYNYASGRYPLERKAHPDRIVVGSETFPQDIWKNWEMVKKLSYVIGDFMWTGWDYLGEAGIGAWAYGSGGGFDKDYPWLLADVGTIDITGYAGAEAYYAKTVWGFNKQPYIGVRPVNHPRVRPRISTWRGTNAFDSWGWQGCNGNQAVVEVYGNADSAALFLNDTPIGKKKVKKCKAIFKLKYAPGKLTAILFDTAGNELSRTSLESANGSLKLNLMPEETNVKTGDIVYVPVTICGENNVVESNADTGVKIQVENGILLGFGSANPCTTDRFTEGYCHTYYGRALAVVKALDKGKMNISVISDTGLNSQTTIFIGGAK